jgi:hypothetical protein
MTMHTAAINDTVRCFLDGDHAALDPKLPELLALLRSRGASQDWHKHGNFMDHLLGVYRILKLWHQAPQVCWCGLLHSVYATEYVDLALFDVRSGRHVLRGIVGDEVEEPIYLFCTMPRSQFASELLSADAMPQKGLMLHDPANGRETQLTREQVDVFVVVSLADFAEQWHSWQDQVLAGYPAISSTQASAKDRWAATLWPGPLRPTSRMLSFLSRLAGHVAHVEAAPPIFQQCSRQLSAESEAAAAALYWRVVGHESPLADIDEAKACLQAAIEHNPFVAEPNLTLAQLLLIEGDHEQALLHADRGLDLLLAWGTPWDKRVPWHGWLAWARVLLQSARVRRWPGSLRDHNQLGLVMTAATGNPGSPAARAGRA